MKKFITVLLVVAVMFTFSFSGAFAAGFTVDKTLAQAQFAVAWKALTDSTSQSILVDVDGDEVSTTDDQYTIKLAVLEANKGAILEAAYALDKTKSDSSYVKDLATLKETVNSDADLYMSLVEAQYAADKEEALAILAGLDTSSFSTEKMTVKTNDQYMTYAEAVKYYISLAEDKINEATFTSDSTVNNYNDAKVEIDKHFNAFANADGNAENTASTTAIAQETGYDENATKYIGLGVYKVNDEFKDAAGKKLATYKTEVVNAENVKDEADKEALKATAKSQYAQYIALNTSTEAVANADKALEATLYTIENGTSPITFVSLVTDETIEAGKDIKTTFLDNYKAAAAFEAFANRYAAEKDATGALIRDPQDVADIVEAAKLAAYQGTTAWTQDSTYKAPSTSYADAVKALSVAGDAAELEYAIKHFEALADKCVSDAKDADTYYAKELAEVEALVAEFKAKAEALTDAAKVATLYNDYFDTVGKKVKAVEVKADAVTGTPDSAAAITVAGDIKDLFATAVTYRTLYNDSIKGTDNDYTEDAYTLANAIKKMVGDAGARTAKDIAALGTEIPALVKALPTNAAVSAALDAADDAVKAAKYTDQASIDAALKAVDDYEALTGLEYTRTTLNGKILSMAYAQNNTLNTEYTKANKADKAALNAIQDKIDAFVDAYEYDTVGNTVKNVFKTLSTNIGTVLANIKLDEAKAVAAKINALPINITEADKATVEAARKAYDDFVAEYTDYENAQSAEAYLATKGVDVSALASAEATLGLNAPETDAEEVAKAYVQDLSIKARSTKTSKGVKVTIKADVQSLLDAGFTVEYKFYRSTKSNKNFGTAKVTKTTNTYLNTSGVKGTKYYYKAKLVVKNAEGEVVATTPLTQCLYATRTF